MRFKNELFKAGIFCDKRFQHFTLLAMADIPRNPMALVIKNRLLTVTVNNYGNLIEVDVRLDENDVVRFSAVVNGVEVGRLVLPLVEFYAAMEVLGWAQ